MLHFYYLCTMNLLNFKTFKDLQNYFEAIYIITSINATGGNLNQTAKNIKIQRSHLYNLLKKYQIKERPGRIFESDFEEGI